MRIIDYIHQGGSLMYVLVALNILGLTLVLWRVLVLLGIRSKITNYSNMLFDQFQQNRPSDDIVAMGYLKEFVKNKVQGLEIGLTTIKTIATIAPLIGLLGTVLGILNSFKVIAEKGLSDPTLFAGGISMALITTVGGLVVAIPHFVGHNYISGILDNIESSLEEKLLPLVATSKGDKNL